METVDTTRQIEELKARLSSRLAEVEEQLRPLQAEAGKIRTQLDLIAKLIRVSSTDAIEKNANREEGTDESSAGESPTDTIAQILSISDGPLHISEIHNRYLATGKMVPGKGTESNLIAYMVRDPRFRRVAKGTYALADGNQPPPMRKRQRRRRRKRVRTSL